MPIVDKNIIREWFKNLKKPTQDHFWAWLDSFYHKWEGIAISGITGLTEALQKKADLVNGLVPEDQLPFTINSNEVIEIGLIETTTNNVKINVHESGSNKVRINGQILTRSFPDNLPFTPVSAGNRFLRIVARNETGLFFIRQSSESDEPQEPGLEPGDVHVRLILVTPTGSQIDPEVLSGFMEKEEESWKEVLLGSSANFTLNYSDKRTRFKVNAINDVPKTLNAIIFSKETTRAVEFWIYNGMNLNINIPVADTDGLSKGFSVSASPFSILPKSYGVLKYNPQTNLIECWKVNASGSSVITDGTLKGYGITGNLLGLSDLKNAEIAGKVDKTATPTQSIASALAIGQMTADEKLHVNGRTKTNSVVLSNEIGTAVPNELGRKNGFLCHSDASGVLRYYSASGLFKFTPTGNFTTSQLKTALDASKITYHDAYVCIVVGSNNYTCNIDNGSSNVSSLLFIGKEGTAGSINFTSSRTINSGSENITIMNGNEGSMTKISHGTSADILTVRNL